MKKEPSVMIFIPLYHPPKEFFSKTIPLLKEQTIKSEIFLISSSTLEDHQNLSNCKLKTIDKSAFCHSNTRNSVLDYEVDYYLFLTQDVTPDDDKLIQNLLDPFEDQTIILSYARQIPLSDAVPSEKFARSVNYPENSSAKSLEDLPRLGIKTFFSSNSCAIYRGDYFRKVGGFAPDLHASEDMEFAARAVMQGYKIHYNANAKVHHSHNYTFKSLYIRYRAIGHFFYQNRWILDTINQYSNISSTGATFALQELKHIFSKHPFHLPRSILQIFIKYIAYNFGLKGYK